MDNKKNLFEIYSMEALVLADMRRYQEALGSIRRALRLNGHADGPHIIKSYIHLKLGKFELAEKEAVRALESNSTDSGTAALLTMSKSLQDKETAGEFHSEFNQGWHSLRKHDLVQAKSLFTQILRRDPHFEPARIAMMECLKTSSQIYRLYLRCLWALLRVLQIKNTFVRWILLAGVMILPELVLKIGRFFLGRPVPIFNQEALVFVYILFFSSWLISGVINFVLLMDPAGRLVLRHEEQLEGLFVGGTLCVGLVIFIRGCFIHSNLWVWVGQGMLCAAVQWSNVFLNDNPKGKLFYGFCGAYMLVGCCIVGFLMQNYGFTYEKFMRALVFPGIFIFISSLILAANSFLYERRSKKLMIHRVDELIKDMTRYHKLTLMQPGIHGFENRPGW